MKKVFLMAIAMMVMVLVSCSKGTGYAYCDAVIDLIETIASELKSCTSQSDVDNLEAKGETGMAELQEKYADSYEQFQKDLMDGKEEAKAAEKAMVDAREEMMQAYKEVMEKLSDITDSDESTSDDTDSESLDADDDAELSYDTEASDIDTDDEADDNEYISSSSSEDWDAALKSYEEYVDKYIKLVKKSQAGDMSALAEYAGMMEKAQNVFEKLDNAKSELTSSQLSKLTRIQTKMLQAAQEM